ncbi:MAG: hypothetical protein GY810_04600 [Aureispira sp.]|nr:hypothetical protein [Aureispira sp.]
MALRGFRIRRKQQYFNTSSIALVHGGQEYFDRVVSLIDTAQKEIHLQTYIFESDIAGQLIINALLKAAKRGVKIYMLLDYFGSLNLGQTTTQKLIAAGVQLKFFGKWNWKSIWFLGRRLHHKIFVVDKLVGLIGGVNISDDYRGTDEKDAWLDYAVEFDGPACIDLATICHGRFMKKRLSKNPIQLRKIKNTVGKVGLLENDWLKGRRAINRAYLRMIKSAQEEIILLSGYFLPNRKFRKALQKAYKRGVQIKIITSGQSDVPFIRYATAYFYDWLLKYGIQFYEWEETILHGKVALFDQKIAQIGSYNINDLSAYGSIEMNVEVCSDQFAQELSTELEHIMAQSKLIKLTRDSSVRRRLLNWFSYLMFKMIFFWIVHLPNLLFKKAEEPEEE